MGPSLITCLWLNALANPSEFFSILSDLKGDRSTLQIIFEMQSQGTS
jgi:hypothetical protein